MGDQTKKRRSGKPQIELIKGGLAKKRKPSNTEIDSAEYENWSINDLYREARKRGVLFYSEMDINELIYLLKSQKPVFD